VQRVSFIFGDGQRNLATAAQRVSLIFGDGQRNLAKAGASFIFALLLFPNGLGLCRGQAPCRASPEVASGPTCGTAHAVIFFRTDSDSAVVDRLDAPHLRSPVVPLAEQRTL